MLLFIIISILLNADPKETNNHDAEDKISIFFDELKRTEIKKIDENLERRTVQVYGVPDATSITLAGQYINILSKNIEKSIYGISLLPKLGTKVEIMVNEEANLTIYNKFPANIVCKTLLVLNLYQKSTILFANSSWLRDDYKMEVITFDDVDIHLQSSVFPAEFKIRNEKSVVSIYLYYKNTHFPRTFMIPPNVTFINLKNSQSNLNFTYLYNIYDFSVFNFQNIDLELDHFFCTKYIQFIGENLKIKLLDMLYSGQVLAKNLELSEIQTILSPNMDYLVKYTNLKLIDQKFSLQVDLPIKSSYNLIEYKNESRLDDMQLFVTIHTTTHIYDSKIVHDIDSKIIKLNINTLKDNIYSNYIIEISKNESIQNETVKSITVDQVSNISSLIPSKLITLIIEIKEKYDKIINFGNFDFEVQTLYVTGPKDIQKISISNIKKVEKLFFTNIELSNSKIKSLTIQSTSSQITKSVNIEVKCFTAANSTLDGKIKGNTLTYNNISENVIFNATGFIIGDMVIRPYSFLNYEFEFMNSTINSYVNSLSSFKFKGSFILNNHRELRYLKAESGKFYFIPSSPIVHLELGSILLIGNDNPVFHENSTIELMYLGEIYFDKNVTYHVKQVILNEYEYRDSNITFVPEILTIKSLRFPGEQKYSCRKVEILPESSSDFIYLDDVEELTLYYRIDAIGYIHIDNFSTKFNPITNKYGGLHISMFNLESKDQFFYDGDWDNFSVEILCAKEFNADFENITFDFISEHWNFNGSTRFFDIERTYTNNETCLSIVKRRHEDNDDDVKPKSREYIIYAAIAGAGVLVSTILITSLCVRYKRKKAVNQFISTDVISVELI